MTSSTSKVLSKVFMMTYVHGLIFHAFLNYLKLTNIWDQKHFFAHVSPVSTVFFFFFFLKEGPMGQMGRGVYSEGKTTASVCVCVSVCAQFGF